MRHIAFPKISSFRRARKTALRAGIDEPLRYVGTVKLHGTNAGVQHTPTGELVVQSRNRIITPDSDNAGFAAFVAENENWFRRNIPTNHVLYGEWAGPGICKGTAVQQHAEKFFAPFDILKIETGDRAVPQLFEQTERIRSIRSGGFMSARVDFVAGDMGAAKEITERIGERCPFAFIDLEIEGVGEGAVWRPLDALLGNNTGLWFKTKSEAYCEKAGEKTPKPPSPTDVESIEAARAVCHPRRLEQGIEYLTEMGYPLDRTSTGTFVKWVAEDAAEEDELPREVARQIGKFAAPWFLENYGD
jgi:hypothetical protein